MSGRRLVAGGLIDRNHRIDFTFDGRAYSGFAGDTLASALLANGVQVVGRSFKLHRPRGIVGAGVEESNALMQVGVGAHTTPNVAATQIELTEGLVARAVNAWPSARNDVGAALGLLAPFIPAGFYYKTFMWPDWHLFEPFIRRAAGLGRAPSDPDPDVYDFEYAHCDVLVVGAGPAGLAAADAAASSGARVILCEQDTMLGGSLLHCPQSIDGTTGVEWTKAVVERLALAPECNVLTRCTAIGYFDHNSVTLLQRSPPELIGAPGIPAMRLWQVRAKHVIFACGAFERPLVFPGNDRPGVMLASAAHRYLARWSVLAGERAVLFTNNDTAYESAHALRQAGVEIAAIVDPRSESAAGTVAREMGIEVLSGAHVLDVKGGRCVRAVTVRLADGGTRRIDADLLLMSGGFDPVTHLHRQAGGKLRWDEARLAFLPITTPQGVISVGACAGSDNLAVALMAGHATATELARQAGFDPSRDCPVAAVSDRIETPPIAFWRAPEQGKAFVDLQNDVTVADIELAVQEGYQSVEHLKRYTTLGMAPDQGKTSNVNGLAILAELTGRSVPATGTTTARFPFTPVAIGALGGRRKGELYAPQKRLPAEPFHSDLGARHEDYGGWRRAAFYPKPDEPMENAIQREALVVRNAVGFLDNSPLGKIEVVGPDAGEFLDRLYANSMSNLAIGRVRYGLMLNERGAIVDDGVTARLAQDHFIVGTTSSGAAHIAGWMDELLQCDWPDLQVVVMPVTNAWTVPTLSGPASRGLLKAIGTDIDLAPDAFPHMSFREGQVCGVPARVYRVSYTGEVTYEINIPVGATSLVWSAILAAGPQFGLEPVGIEAVMRLRTEKGFIHIGSETDGSTTPDDIGWGHVLKRKKDFLGGRSLTLADNQRSDRMQLVGLEIGPECPPLPIGAQIRAPAGLESDGHVTSSGYSPVLDRGVALAMVVRGRDRHGEKVQVVTRRGDIAATIVAPCVFDREGERVNA